MTLLNPDHPLFKNIARVFFILNILIISALAFLPGEEVPTLSVWDKANHFIAFCVLSGLLGFCFQKPTEGILTRVVLPLIAYGFFIEIVQSFLPSRYFSFMDVLADFVGIIIGIGCMFTYMKLFTKSNQ